MISNVFRKAAPRVGVAVRSATLASSNASPTIIRPLTIAVTATRPMAIPLSRSLATKAATPSQKTSSATATAQEKTAKQQEKSKELKLKEQSKLKEQARKEREKEKARKEREKEKARKEKVRLQKQVDLEKKRVAREKALAQKEKEKLKKVQAREKAAQEKAEAKRKAARGQKWELIDENGNKVPLPTANKPARVNAFITFMQHKASQTNNTGVRGPVLVKQWAEEWRALPESAKESYFEEARRQNADYGARLQKWTDSLTQQDLARLQAYDEHRAKLAKKAGKSVQSTVPKERKTRPLRPAGAFFRFAADIRRDSGSKPVVEAVREAANQWRDFSAEQKRPYEQAFQRDYETYKKVLAAWKSSNAAALEGLREASV